MSPTGQQQIPKKQSRAHHGLGHDGPQPLTTQVHNASHEASHPGPSRNAAGSTQSRRPFEDTNDLDLTATASISKELQNTYILCPSHGLFSHSFPDLRLQPGPSPMERYLTEGPAAQHALFIRPDTGRLSTVRDCTCRARIEVEYGHQIRK